MRLFALAVALWLAFVLAVLPPAASPSAPPRLTADELRFYLQGWLDGALPVEWSATKSRCVHGRTSHVFACLVVTRSTRGQVACWRAAVSETGRFLVPITRDLCPTDIAKGPAS